MEQIKQQINIPFKPFFREPILSGTKRYTSRTRIMGKPGDRFLAFGATFELLSVEDCDLYSVALLWKEEGCRSREHFIEVWNEIHPRKPFNPINRVYLHHFKKVDPLS